MTYWLTTRHDANSALESNPLFRMVRLQRATSNSHSYDLGAHYHNSHYSPLRSTKMSSASACTFLHESTCHLGQVGRAEAESSCSHRPCGRARPRGQACRWPRPPGVETSKQEEQCNHKRCGHWLWESTGGVAPRFTTHSAFEDALARLKSVSRGRLMPAMAGTATVSTRPKQGSNITSSGGSM